MDVVHHCSPDCTICKHKETVQNKRKRQEEEKKEEEERINTKRQKVGEVLCSFAQDLESGKVTIENEEEFEAVVTKELLQRVWELPLDAAVCEWIGRDEETRKVMETIPELRNYRLPEDILLELKDNNTIRGKIKFYLLFLFT